MFKLAKSLIFTALCLIIAPNNGYAQSKQTNLELKWAFMHLPPIAYLDKNGKAKGSLVELMDNVSRISGIPYTPLEFPNLRAIFELDKQNVNFTIAVKSLIKNEHEFVISPFPVDKMQLQIIWQKDTADVTGVEQLKGADVILLAGYTYGGIRPTIENVSKSIFEVQTHDQALSALNLGRGQYALTYKTASEVSMSGSKFNATNYKSRIIGEVDLYFILNADVSGAEQIMNQLEKAYLAHKSATK